jgi:hypothetical protein
MRSRFRRRKAGGQSARGNWKFCLSARNAPALFSGAGENFHCAARAARYAAVTKRESRGVEDTRASVEWDMDWPSVEVGNRAEYRNVYTTCKRDISSECSRRLRRNEFDPEYYFAVASIAVDAWRPIS